MAKAYEKTLKTKIETPLTSFIYIRYIAKNASKILKGFQNAVRKVACICHYNFIDGFLVVVDWMVDYT